MTNMVLLGVGLMLAASLAFMVPSYLGIWAGLYWVYEQREITNPMPGLRYEPSQVWDQFMIHWHFLQEYWTELSWSELALPLLLPVLVGTIVGLAACYGVMLYMVNIFRVTD